MRKISLLWGLACLLAAADCFADTRNVEALIDEKLLLPAYKLGGSYKSKNDNSVSCLEGHSGAILNNKTCLAGNNAKPCTESECNKLGEGYYCSGVTKKCEWEECSDTTDCAWAYAKAMSVLPEAVIDSDFRTCEANNGKTSDANYCAVTCSLEHIIAKSGLTQAEADRMLKLLAADLAAYKKPSKAVEYYRELTYDKNDPDANGIWDAAKFDLLMSECDYGSIASMGTAYTTSPACIAAQGSTYGQRDETGDIPIYGRGGGKASFRYTPVETGGYTKWEEKIYGSYDASTDTVIHQCVAYYEYTDAAGTTVSGKDYVLRAAARSLIGHNLAESIRKHFKAGLNNKEAYASNAAFYERLKEPEIYYLGISPVCALYDKSDRNLWPGGDVYAKHTKYMFYIPQQDVIAWRRHKKEGSTGFSSRQWDLSTGDRIACCADVRLHGTISGSNAIYCIDLTNDYDVVDIE